MKNGQIEFTMFERLIVVAIILFLVAIVVENVLATVQVSEERTVHAAAVEYSALRNAYAEMYRLPSSTARPYNTLVQ